MKLPNAENAIIDINKLKYYCLCKEHPVGKYKAHMFESCIGLTQDNAEDLKNFILREILGVETEKTTEDKYGSRYFADIEYKTLEKNFIIRTCWIILKNEYNPRLTSCYIKL
ncbi:MAG: hypothetical protein HY958_09845 [Bacteroidia bacterium]|nr:hypothetical protein [Bacteroidia bacterium]